MVFLLSVECIVAQFYRKHQLKTNDFSGINHLPPLAVAAVPVAAIAIAAAVAPVGLNYNNIFMTGFPFLLLVVFLLYVLYSSSYVEQNLRPVKII